MNIKAIATSDIETWQQLQWVSLLAQASNLETGSCRKHNNLAKVQIQRGANFCHTRPILQIHYV